MRDGEYLRKTSPETISDGQKHGLASAGNTSRLLMIIVILLLGLALPAVISWVEILIKIGFRESTIPILTVLFLGVALFLKRSTLFSTPLQPSTVGLGVLVMTGTVYLTGYLLGIKILFWGGFLTVVASLYWALWGGQRFYRGMPLFLFSLFLLPHLPVDFKTAVGLPLQLFSTWLATGLAGVWIPIQSQGNIFYINGEAYEVTVACSGLHTWIAYLFAGLLWLLFETFSWRTLAGIMIWAPILALGMNTVRLVITAWVAYWVTPDAGLSVHTNLDYLLFPLGLLLMVGLSRKMRHKIQNSEFIVQESETHV